MSIYFKWVKIAEQQWKIRRGDTNIHRVCKNNNIVWDVNQERNGTFYLCSTGGLLDNTFTIEFDTDSIEYKVGDSGSWTTATTSPLVIDTHNPENVYLKNECTIETPNYHISAKYDYGAYGDISALMTPEGKLTTARCNLSGMFENSTNLQVAPELPFTTLKEGMYKNMFKGCTYLTDVPDNLPAETLTDNCYEGMFEGCTRLYDPPTLSATTLAEGCYKYMFKDCDSLAETYDLTITDLKPYCYEGMYMGCTGLTTVHDLPAETLQEGCYQDMFNGSGITNSVDLTSETLAKYCYRRMFKDCVNIQDTSSFPATYIPERAYESMYEGCTYEMPHPHIQEIKAITTEEYGLYRMFYNATWFQYGSPFSLVNLAEHCCEDMFNGINWVSIGVLPATELKPYCYKGMLANQGALSLNPPPELPARTLVEGCYNSLFENDSTLDYIVAWMSDWVDGTTDDWVKNVSGAGLFIGQENLTEIYDDSHIPVNWNNDNPFYFIASEDNATVTVNCLKDGQTLQYSNDRYNWTTLSAGLTEIPLDKDRKYYFQGDVIMRDDDYKDSSGAYVAKAFFSTSADTACIECHGNVGWIAGADTDGVHLERLFYNNRYLTTCPIVNSNPGSYGFRLMFAYCRNLLSPPIISADTFISNSCYHMFEGISGTWTAGPAVVVKSVSANAFTEMYAYCTNIVSGGTFDFSNCTINAYTSQIFNSTYYQCTSLTEPPVIKFKSKNPIPDQCFYHTFKGAVNLKSPIDLSDAIVLFNGTNTNRNQFDSTYAGNEAIKHVPASAFAKCYYEQPYTHEITNYGIPKYCYYRMFKDSLVESCDDIVAYGHIGSGAFSETFSGCDNLINAPKFSWKRLESISGTDNHDELAYRMFYHCDNLKTASTFSNYKKYFMGTKVLANQYENCIGLTSIDAGDTIIDTNYGGRYQFNEYKYKGCTALTEITYYIVIQSYQTSEITYNNRGTFKGCTGLTKAYVKYPQNHLPDNIAVGDLDEMFYGCSNLSYVYYSCWFVLESASPLTGAENWLYGVPEDGTFDWNVDEQTASGGLRRGPSGVPYSWTLNILDE